MFSTRTEVSLGMNNSCHQALIEVLIRKREKKRTERNESKKRRLENQTENTPLISQSNFP